MRPAYGACEARRHGVTFTSSRTVIGIMRYASDDPYNSAYHKRAVSLGR